VKRARRTNTVGVSDHGGWAILVTVSPTGAFVDRRRVTLVDPALPALPHHVDGQLVPLDEAVALVHRVRTSAELHARDALASLAREVGPLSTIALRTCATLPPTIEERLTNVRARNNADWVMYRVALAGAATALDWRRVDRCEVRRRQRARATHPRQGARPTVDRRPPARDGPRAPRLTVDIDAATAETSQRVSRCTADVL
jgi:hypothetical protein